jgi:DNA-binding CsgD family transcriptional regulator
MEGYSLTEIAKRLKISQRSVSTLVDELRTELEQLQPPR